MPNDAELSRTLVATQREASLCTMTSDGFPYGSAVSYVDDATGAPILLISEMAEHTINARGDNRVSILVTPVEKTHGGTVSATRLTLVGRLHMIKDPGQDRVAYIEGHPDAASYADFNDFSFWRLQIYRCRYIGGFGRMSWVTPADYSSAKPDLMCDIAESIIARMNADYEDANLIQVQVLAGLRNASKASVINIDRCGITMRAVTPEGSRIARIGFPAPLQSPDQWQAAVRERLDEANSITTAPVSVSRRMANW